jgi:Tol biopolymer transport system component
MNPSVRLEQDLTDWLRETAMPHTPDYTDEILDQTLRIRQRPRWSFLGRWVPMPDVRPTALVGGHAILRAVMLLLILGLILAAIAPFVGSRRTLPPPFGLAGNGLLASSVAGDIVIVDHESMVTRSIVAEAAVDQEPRWSLDGTRVACLRDTADRQAVVIADAHGRTLAVSAPFADIDSDSVAWAPNGRQVLIAAARGNQRAIYLIDATTGASRDLGVQYIGFEVYWRPPDGRQLLFRIGDAAGGLAIVSVDDGSVVRVPTGEYDPNSLRPLGWTPDGRAVLFQDDDLDPLQTVVVDVQTGAQTRLDVAFGHISNEGTRIAGTGFDGRFCVLEITGGACRIGIADAVAVVGSHGASVSWSPDDRWIAISRSPVWLVDPAGAVPPRAVAEGGPAAWQRTLP